MLYRIITAAVNFLIIPLSLAVLFKIKKREYITAAVILIFMAYLILSCVFFIKLNIANILISIFIFGGCVFLLYILSGISDMELNSSIKKLKSVEDEYKEIDEKNYEIKMNNDLLETRVSEIANLYQISKKMSQVLEFEEILKIICEILESFKFSRGQLIIVQEGKEKCEISKIYQIPPSEDKNQIGNEDAVLDLFLDNKFPVLIESAKDPLRENLFIKDEVNTFFAQPLIMRDRLEAILVLEDLPEKDFKKVIIIGDQLALQLERIRLYELVQQLAITDGLTGIFSRRHIMERFDEELKRSARFGTKLAFLMVDIDNFKDYNDKYGHLVGDVVLKDTALVFKNNLRQLDLIGRFGGEEFCVVLPETNKESATAVGERLREEIMRHIFKAYDEVMRITVSIGVAVFPDDTEDLQQLLDRADQALYKAKQTGRNKVCVYMKG